MCAEHKFQDDKSHGKESHGKQGRKLHPNLLWLLKVKMKLQKAGKCQSCLSVLLWL